jgi:cell division protein FtsL
MSQRYSSSLGWSRGYAVRKKNAYTKQDSYRAQLILKSLVLVVFTVILSLFYIWTRVQVTGQSYEITALQSQIVKVQNKHRHYHMEWALLNSPTRLEKVASEKLGMRMPTPAQVFELKIND